ncbi:chondroitin sulfate proteoglycan 4, partial [Hyalella azteca]|uniref:Chondroitin sulfate proteoglycan 4 n=1 Tax=Hyalella azteca TaxID=294128 RepID=A0A979FWV5_HYAAZ
ELSSSCRVSLGGRFQELNIQQGLLLGGLGDYNKLFLGLLDPYRGCLQQVSYNGVSVLQRARDPASGSSVHAVEWRCSDVFAATPDSAVSFVAPNSFVSFVRNFPRKGATITFQMKTQGQDCVIFYATGPPSRSDLVALELSSGCLRLTLDLGDGAVVLNSSLRVSPGSWHAVSALVSPSSLALVLDEQRETRPSPTGANKYVDVTGDLHVGGVAPGRRARATRQGISVNSLVGCVRGVQLEGVTLGLHNAAVSASVAVGCSMSAPCTAHPCIPGAACLQTGLHSYNYCSYLFFFSHSEKLQNFVQITMHFLPFMGHIDPALPGKRTYRITHAEFLSIFGQYYSIICLVWQVMKLNPVMVDEGKEVIISLHHLMITLDYSKFGIRKSGIIFHVTRQPPHGTILLRPSDRNDTSRDTDYPNPAQASARSKRDVIMNIDDVIVPPDDVMHHYDVMMPSIDVMELFDDVMRHDDVAMALNDVRRSLVDRPFHDAMGPFDDVMGPVDDVMEPLDDIMMPVNDVMMTFDDVNMSSHDAAVASRDIMHSYVSPITKINYVPNHEIFHESLPHDVVQNTHKNPRTRDNFVRHDRVTRSRRKAPGVHDTLVSFTLHDVERSSVRYQHDGTETQRDSALLQLQLITQPGYLLPAYLQLRHELVLPVAISPVNDAPSLELPEGPTVRGVRGATLPLTTALITARDPDTPDSHLMITVLGHKGGYISSKNVPAGQQVTSFTQEDLVDGKIFYVSTTSEDSRLLFKASDGESSSVPVVLRISTYELQVYLVNNTGIKIVHGSSTVIMPTNLSCSSNSEGQNISLLYLITRKPKFGTLQVQDSEGKWNDVLQFSEEEILGHKVRYTHQKDKPKLDGFHFKISAVGKSFPEEYLFAISFISVSVEVVRNAELVMTAIMESFISEGYLYAVTHPKPSPRSEIVYTIVTLPKFGGIYLSTGDLIYQRRLSTNTNFTQDDVTKGRLKYKLNYVTYSDFYDSFLFRVASNLHESREEVFKISYKAPPFDGVVTQQSLVLREGSYKAINGSNIRVTGPSFKRVIYSVIKSPEHGLLYVAERNTRSIVRHNATFFSGEEIDSNALFYQHDDSENFRDNLQFIAISEDARPNFQIVGSLKIEVIPQNDNAPVSLVKKVLNVVEENSRTITPDDVQYFDLDLATSPMQIQFTNINVDSGYFFNINAASTPIERFSQQDINDHVVRFQHKSKPYSNARFTVTDGLLSSDDELEIVAAEPYLEIVNNSGIIVARGSQTLITSWNLSAITNLDTWLHKLVYTVVDGPKYGVLKLHTNDQVRAVDRHGGSLTFTADDLRLGRLFYRHDGSAPEKDAFKFTVEVLHISTGGVLDINVFPTSYWEPFHYHASVSLSVEELSKATLSPVHLSLHHPSVPARHVRYTVTHPPVNGVLTVTRAGKMSKAIWFTAEEVRRGVVEYSATRRNVTRDVISYVVSNGVTASPQLHCNIQITRRRPMVAGGTFSVREGHTRPVPQSVLRKLTSLPVEFSQDKISFIENHPASKFDGRPQYSSSKNNSIVNPATPDTSLGVNTLNSTPRFDVTTIDSTSGFDVPINEAKFHSPNVGKLLPFFSEEALHYEGNSILFNPDFEQTSRYDSDSVLGFNDRNIMAKISDNRAMHIEDTDNDVNNRYYRNSTEIPSDSLWTNILVRNEPNDLNSSSLQKWKFFEKFEVVKPPKEGKLKLDSRPQLAVSTLTRAELEHGELLYEHSGSESPRDDFIIVRVLGLSSSSKP